MRPVRSSLILDTTTRAIFPPVVVFSLYLLFVGHNAPGGGFVGGLTAGIALVLLYAGGGITRVRGVARVPYEALLGGGLLLACGTGLASLLLGAEFQSSAILETELPLLGHVKLVTVLFFDIGVYVIVVGLALGLINVLGAPGGDGEDGYGDADHDGYGGDDRAAREDHGGALHPDGNGVAHAGRGGAERTDRDGAGRRTEVRQ